MKEYAVDGTPMTTDEIIEFARLSGWNGLMGVIFALHEGIAYLQQAGFTVEKIR